jgi:hypothetical protein
MTVRGANYPRKENDFYATPAETTRVLLDTVRFTRIVVDPASGEGAILKVLNEYGYAAYGSDLKKKYDFLTDKFRWKDCDIVTNPPFGVQGRMAVQFVLRALTVTKTWHGKVAMLLPVDFDSGKTRAPIFRDCPRFSLKIVLLNRIRWFNNVSGSTNHAWFVWDHKHTGSPRLRYGIQRYQDIKTLT